MNDIDVHAEDEGTPTQSDPWRGRPPPPHDWATDGDDPALDPPYTEPVRDVPPVRVPAVPYDREPTAPLPELARVPVASRTRTGTPARDDVLANLWRAVRAGRRELKDRYRRHTTIHADQWKLDALRPHYGTKAKDYDALEAQIKEDLESAARKVWIPMAALYVALPILFFVAHRSSRLWALAVCFIVAAVHVVVLAWYGRHAYRPVVPDTEAPEPVRVPVRETHLSVRVLAQALRDAGFERAVPADRDDVISITVPRPMDNGWSCTLTLPASLTANKVLDKRIELAAALDTTKQCLILLKTKRSEREVFVWLADHDPLKGPPTVQARVVGSGAVDVWNGIPLGTSIHGQPIVASVLDTGCGWLVAGAPRSGKSFLARLLAAYLAKDPHVRLMLIDPDDAGMWEPFSRVGEYIGGDDRATLEHVATRLEAVVAEIETRREGLKEWRRRYPMQVTGTKVTKELTHDRKLNCPVLFVAIDECHMLMRESVDADLRDRIVNAVQTIATRGGKFGIGILLITQVASVKNIPGIILRAMSTRCCLAVPDSTVAGMALGDGWREDGMDPTALDPEVNSGAFILRGPGKVQPDLGTWVLGMSEHLDDNEVRVTLEEARAIRERIRPDLLPSDGPGPSPAPAPPERLAPINYPAGDPHHLYRLACIFAPDPILRSQTIVERLQSEYPGVYDHLTVRGIGPRLLAPFRPRLTVPLHVDPQLVVEGGRNYAGLRFADVYRALLELAPELAQELPGKCAALVPGGIPGTSGEVPV